MFKKTLLIDLDGVLNQYKGDFNKDIIPPVLNGAKEFLNKISQKYDIKIFTTRNKLKTVKWLIENELDIFIIDITDKKELAWAYIDDRCIQFRGDFKQLIHDLEIFKPWYHN
ncbi:hypothetical protein IJG72_00430 [bacterium]|nr:hypothetical protein [bacterium]